MKRLPKCRTHGAGCAGRRTAEQRLAYAAELRAMGEDPGEWADVGWSPTVCASEAADHKIVLFGGFADFDEDAHNALRPHEKFPGFVRDLGCAEVKKVWKNYVVRPDGSQGPVFRNRAERAECLRRAGFRATDPGEIPKVKSLHERMADGPRLKDYLR